jgi:hypothetical protein
VRCWQENSLVTDYVSEKLFDAFVAGCVPLYYGALNIEDFLPDPESIIDYRQAAQRLIHAAVAEVRSSTSPWSCAMHIPKTNTCLSRMASCPEQDYIVQWP